MAEFRMPSLGADMEVGTILEWRVQPGQEVHRGDIVAVVDTEKSTIEIEVFHDGVVEDLVVDPGVEVPVGTVLAHITAAGAAAPAPVPAETAAVPAEAPLTPATAPAHAEAPATEAPAAREAPARAPTAKRRARRKTAVERPAARPAAGAGGFVRASPLARRRAAAQGIALEELVGTGPGGAVITADVGAAARAAPAPAAREVRPPTAGPAAPADRHAAMRHAIGELMARSKREIPHYYLATTIDLGAALAWLAEANASRPVAERLLPAALLLKATARAAREVPVVNGFWEGGFRPAPAVHLGVAVSLRGGGLVAPAIHDADELSIDDLMRSLRDLVTRARSGVLRGSEVSDSTITVTNLGDQGVEEVFGVIYPPQVALVGFGRVSERPWAAAGMVGVRPVVRATLAADHRASDGHDGARFLAAIDRLLAAPEGL
ncbi:MAG TPA: dihydrolipoamide acetyltransferase family protein [Acidimicrobiales bacterium]|nr:dihydrolipoamide acetyltransferase family protein [Acidimicrobiales bacterium]